MGHTLEAKRASEDAERTGREVRRVTWIGLVINIALSAAKFVAGVVGNSQAMVADAVHSISDCATDVAVLVGSRYWMRPPDESHPYGHRRIETIVTLFIAFALVGTACGLIWDAVSSIRLRHSQPVGIIAAWAALASMVTKEFLYRWTASVGRRLRSSAMVANAWHHRSDMISSIPAFAAIGVALAFPNWNFVDHVGAVVVSVFIFHVALKIGLPSMREILEAGAPREVIAQISSLALEEKGVLGVHQIRSRYVSNSLILDMHIVVDALTPLFQADIIADTVRKRLLEQREDILDVVVHMDPDRIPDTKDRGRS